MSFGSRAWRPWVLERDEARPFFRRAIEHGINFFDTADAYSLGVSEEITGAALREFGRLEELVIATKVRFGKLEWPASVGTVNAYVLEQGFRPLPISLGHAERAGQLRIAHRDPFDRMLIAQALTEEMWLASNEEFFDSAGVKRYW